MTVSRRELPRSRSASPGSEDALSHRSLEGSPFVAPLLRCSDAWSISGLGGLAGHERPDKAAELSGDGGDGDLRPFPAPPYAALAAVGNTTQG